MKVFVITLPEAVERQEQVIRQLNAADIEFQFVPAVADENAVNGPFCDVYADLNFRGSRKKMTAHEVARFLSHRLVWKMCVNLNEPVLVMQDDFVLSKNFNDAVGMIAKFIRKYGLIGMQSERTARKRKIFRQDRFRLRHKKAPDVASCYGISPLAAERLVKFGKVISLPVEKYLSRSWRHGQQMFGLTPYAISEGSPGARAHSRKRSSACPSSKTANRGVLEDFWQWFLRRTRNVGKRQDRTDVSGNWSTVDQ